MWPMPSSSPINAAVARKFGRHTVPALITLFANTHILFYLMHISH